MYKKQPIEGDFNKKRTLKTQEITFMIKMITDPRTNYSLRHLKHKKLLQIESNTGNQRFENGSEPDANTITDPRTNYSLRQRIAS